jgi:putative NADH-flavin reductase
VVRTAVINASIHKQETLMKIVLFGPGGNVGRHIAAEALSRGHEVIGVAREPQHLENVDKRMRLVKGDATDAASVAQVAAGADAIVNSISPRPGSHGKPAPSMTVAARALIAGAKRAGVKRLVIVGGAGSLEVAPGMQLVDTPQFPEAYKPEALAHREALAVYRAEANDLDWVYISPPIMIEPGPRTGKYRTGGDQVLFNDKGESRISFEDYAMALVDELEQRKNMRKRTTVAY